jgi:hypothetical protein
MQIPVKIELEQVGRVIAWPAAPGRIGFGISETGGPQVEFGHEGFQKAHRVVRADVVLQGRGQQPALMTIRE